MRFANVFHLLGFLGIWHMFLGQDRCEVELVVSFFAQQYSLLGHAMGIVEHHKYNILGNQVGSGMLGLLVYC